MTLTFEEIRKIITDKCMEMNACSSQNTPYDQEFDKLVRAESEADFWEEIKRNAYWAHSNGAISVELFARYDHDVLNANQIFVSGKHEMKKGLAMLLGGNISNVWGGNISNVWGGNISDVFGGNISTVRGVNISNVWGGNISDVWGGNISNFRGGNISNFRGGNISDVWGGNISTVWGGNISNFRGGKISDVWGGTISNVRGNIDNIKSIGGTAMVRSLSTKKIYIKKGEFEIIQL
jgi:hypothetical protein